MDALPSLSSPADLPSLEPEDVRGIPAGTRLFRVHLLGGKHPQAWNKFRSWGPNPRGRFDHQDPAVPPAVNETTGDRAVWYGAITAAPGPAQPPGHGLGHITALAKAFQTRRVIDRQADAPRLTTVEPIRPLRLLYAESAWGTRAGCGRLLGTARKDRTRDWSRAIYAAYPDIDGIVWTSSVWPPGDAVFLYERASDAFPAQPASSRPLADPSLERNLEAVAGLLGWPVR